MASKLPSQIISGKSETASGGRLNIDSGPTGQAISGQANGDGRMNIEFKMGGSLSSFGGISQSLATMIQPV